jgi:hypothetical protein
MANDLKFRDSRKQFYAWKNKTNKISGFCLWQIEFAGFLLEAWNDQDGHMVIFQIFENGRGFLVYKPDRNYYK